MMQAKPLIYQNLVQTLLLKKMEEWWVKEQVEEEEEDQEDKALINLKFQFHLLLAIFTHHSSTHPSLHLLTHNILQIIHSITIPWINQIKYLHVYISLAINDSTTINCQLSFASSITINHNHHRHNRSIVQLYQLINQLN